MRFLDVNTFYGPKAGGIRTYHLQKIAWFKAHPEHQYILVGPGPSTQVEEIAPNIHYYRFKGFALTSDPEGYRLLWDFWSLLRLIRQTQPDVLEAGEPWLTGIFCIVLSKLRLYKGRLSAFYHSDPIRTYFEPWAHKGRFSFLKRLLLKGVEPGFFFLQRRYDLTLTSSRVMRSYLDTKKVKTALTPFGAPNAFFQAWRPYAIPAQGPIQLLYAGRLDKDKGIELLIESMSEILALPNVTLTVVGRGAYTHFFENFEHPNYKWGGYVHGAQAFIKVLAEHHLLLAPGPYETFALGVLEAMAMGLPVVGPDQGGTAELLAQVDKPFLFKSHDAQDFLRVLNTALASDLESAADSHHEIALEYGPWERCFQNMLHIYQRAES